jgi:hypothetical protein
MNDSSTIVENMLIHHAAFVRAQKQLEQCFIYSANKAEAEGLAIIGESGTGKTSVLKDFKSTHKPTRSADGMEVPILYVKVPANPAVKSLQGAIIHELGASDSDRGTEGEKERKVKILLRNTGNRMIMFDEFQHLYDRGTRRIMIHAADWLKGLIDDTRSTIVVAGLPSAQNVIEENPQLERRFLAPIHLPQFSWHNVDERDGFCDILEVFHSAIAKEFKTPELHSEVMAYQFWRATEGQIACLVKILRHALRKAADEDRTVICLEDFAAAREISVSLKQWPVGEPKPFDRGFQLVPTLEMPNCVADLGSAASSNPANSPRAGKRPRKESIDYLQRAS